MHWTNKFACSGVDKCSPEATFFTGTMVDSESGRVLSRASTAPCSPTRASTKLFTNVDVEQDASVLIITAEYIIDLRHKVRKRIRIKKDGRLCSRRALIKSPNDSLTRRRESGEIESAGKLQIRSRWVSVIYTPRSPTRAQKWKKNHTWLRIWNVAQKQNNE